MDRRLGLSNQALCRIGRRLVAQAAPADPSEGTFLFSPPGGVAGADTADLEMRVTQLETAVQGLQQGLSALQQAPAPKAPRKKSPSKEEAPVQEDPFYQQDMANFYSGYMPFG